MDSSASSPSTAVSLFLLLSATDNAVFSAAFSPPAPADGGALEQALRGRHELLRLLLVDLFSSGCRTPASSVEASRSLSCSVGS